MKHKPLIYQIGVIKLGIDNIRQCLALDRLTHNGIWTEKQWEKELTAPERICVGILKDKFLIGFACGSLISSEVNITLVSVDPSYQRHGLGTLLINSLLSYSNNLGSNIAILEVKENNHTAQLFYKELNFNKIGFRPKLYKDGTNAIILSKNL